MSSGPYGPIFCTVFIYTKCTWAYKSLLLSMRHSYENIQDNISSVTAVEILYPLLRQDVWNIKYES